MVQCHLCIYDQYILTLTLINLDVSVRSSLKVINLLNFHIRRKTLLFVHEINYSWAICDPPSKIPLLTLYLLFELLFQSNFDSVFDVFYPFSVTSSSMPLLNEKLENKQSSFASKGRNFCFVNKMWNTQT